MPPLSSPFQARRSLDSSSCVPHIPLHNDSGGTVFCFRWQDDELICLLQAKVQDLQTTMRSFNMILGANRGQACSCSLHLIATLLLQCQHIPRPWR